MLSAALAYATDAAAARHRDARVVLVSLAFLAAGFLGLHALATPGVLLQGPNTGFTIATPVGLTLAAGFAAASVTSLGGPRATTVLRWRRALLAVTLASIVGWALVSLAGLPPLDGPLPAREGPGILAALTIVGGGALRLGGVAVLDLYRRVPVPSSSRSLSASCCWRRRWSPCAQPQLALSWWEWHLLMLAAFVAIAYGARASTRAAVRSPARSAGCISGRRSPESTAGTPGRSRGCAEADARGEQMSSWPTPSGGCEHG